MENQHSIKLSLQDAGNAVESLISNIIGRRIQSVAVIEDYDYWNIVFKSDRLTPEEHNMLFDAVGATPEERANSLPEDGENINVDCITMAISEKLLFLQLKCRCERCFVGEGALWLVGVRSCSDLRPIEVDGISVPREILKSKVELVNYLKENGPTHSVLMDFCEEYRNRYQNELCWHYPISDDKHLGTYLVLVKEGVISLPYDEANEEDYEIFLLDDIRFFSAQTMQVFLDDWEFFSTILTNVMTELKKYLLEKEKEK